jgi:hypothetical protein
MAKGAGSAATVRIANLRDIETGRTTAAPEERPHNRTWVWEDAMTNVVPLISRSNHSRVGWVAGIFADPQIPRSALLGAIFRGAP